MSLSKCLNVIAWDNEVVSAKQMILELFSEIKLHIKTFLQCKTNFNTGCMGIMFHNKVLYTNSISVVFIILELNKKTYFCHCLLMMFSNCFDQYIFMALLVDGNAWLTVFKISFYSSRFTNESFWMINEPVKNNDSLTNQVFTCTKK